MALVIDTSEFASGADKLILAGTARTMDGSSLKTVDWRAKASWDDVFRDVGPILQNEASEGDVKEMLARYVGWDSNIKGDSRDHDISDESFAVVMVQLRALGLIQRGKRKRAVSDIRNYWELTKKGESYLIGILARKKTPTLPAAES